MAQRKRGFYEKYIKRVLDVVCALLALTVFSWLYLLIAITVRVKLGKPVLFKQPRPGMLDPKTGQERIFDMYKFRTMSDARNERGELLPDEQRLDRFGRFLRITSLDELPEAINILKGEMSVIGPRPQLVKDMVFMTDKQRIRHTAKPGLSGLAQIRGRNAISWEEKFYWDLKYIDNISFFEDFYIVLITIWKVLKREESAEELSTTDDYGDALLKKGRITELQYNEFMTRAEKILMESQR